MKAKPAELTLSLGILALGVAAAVGTSQLPSAGGYARIGPNIAPAVISGGLILLGLWLLYETFSGGWRNAIADDPAERGEHRFTPSAFIWVSAGLFAQILLIHRAGFVLAQAALFCCVARGFGSSKWPRDLAVGCSTRSFGFLLLCKILKRQSAGGMVEALARRRRHLVR